MLRVEIYRARHMVNFEWKYQWYWRVSRSSDIIANAAEGNGYANRAHALHEVCVLMHIDEDTVHVPARGGFEFEVEE